MERPKNLDNVFIRFDILSHEVAPIGCAKQLRDHIQRYGSAIVRDLMTDAPVEVYEGQTGLLGRPVGQRRNQRSVALHH